MRAAEPRRGANDGEEFWYQPWGWVSSLAMTGGIGISPELAMTLSYVQCAVQTISDDIGAMTCQFFADLGDGAHKKVQFGDPGIGALAYRCRWQPNRWQSSKAFWSTLVWQYLLRPAAYAEIVYRPGSTTMINELIPRHPDRVEQQVLPSGQMRFKITEPVGPPRYVMDTEMFVVRNTSADGLNALSRTDYGGKGLATGLALQDYTRIFFKKGATAALLATYKGGEMEDEEEKSLHQSISRYVSGVENAGGVLLVPEDIDVKNLGVDPEKAQLLGLKDLSGRDVARMWKMPPHKLGISGTQTYASQVQSAQEYVSGTLQPIVVEFEQAIYIHLIVARDYFAKFNMDTLVRSDLLTRMQAYEVGIRSRVLRPSEARAREDMSPDAELDRLAAQDHRPSEPTGARADGPMQPRSQGGASVKAVLVANDTALRILRRERGAVEKLAKRHASDAEGWQAGLREFYAEHAPFVADALRMPSDLAHAYASEHAEALATRGIAIMDEQWERQEAETLTRIACEDDLAPGGQIHLRIINTAPAPAQISVPITAPVTIDAGAIQVDVDARTTVAATEVNVQPTPVQNILPRPAGPRSITFEKRDGAIVGATIEDRKNEL